MSCIACSIFHLNEKTSSNKLRGSLYNNNVSNKSNNHSQIIPNQVRIFNHNRVRLVSKCHAMTIVWSHCWMNNKYEKKKYGRIMRNVCLLNLYKCQKIDDAPRFP